jgi:O-acetyl-ADP-ribose deacetylase (regulator of RNase III)
VREAVGDLFTHPADAIVIPVNWTTKRNGDAVMGAGVAKQAAERWPELPQRLGMAIHFAAGPAPQRFVMSSDGQHVVCFPTKGDWRQPSTIEAIEFGSVALVRLAEYWGWKTVTLPRLGCGLGKLDWDDVRPVLAKHLDDRFIVLSASSTGAAHAGGEG